LILYLDSSSLVKLFFAEAGSNEVRTLVASASVVATSRVALPEAAAGLARLGRERVLDAEGVVSRLSALHQQWQGFVSIEINETRAAKLAVKHGLRGFDSVHLAAALDLREGAGPGADLRFSSFDRRLNAAAASEGLEVPR
jgi:predicted nucleic acid-binding protein